MRSVSLRLRCRIVWLVFLIASTLVVSTLAGAQQKYVAPRITEPLDEGRRTVLKGNIHPLARAQFEVTAAPPNLRMDRMLLVLKRSSEQETALLKLLDDQQDKSSSDYHKWLTPEQLGSSSARPTPTFKPSLHGFRGMASRLCRSARAAP
jgi:hypothetical protein